ncbi:hypothetical protein [Chitinophaga niabensis]|uniref:Uncharacterized protein n=1 Tax=Chitinophaga niabensis TaxID=536979 RepID=A0A1N6JLR4_9BACT|nr:hypothetical protein [Chitinophaga niabensis]SIO45285.1 hypothetical protein SAMN04488055_4158 [Chitinophaga niabensis]
MITSHNNLAAGRCRSKELLARTIIRRGYQKDPKGTKRSRLPRLSRGVYYYFILYHGKK